MARTSVAFAALALAAAVGCASRRDTAAPQASAARAPAAAPAEVMAGARTPEGPVIVRLVGQHPTITVTSSPSGPRYSAQSKDGRTIVSGATLEELQANHPDLAKFVRPGIAADASIEAGSPESLGAYDARYHARDARRYHAGE